MKRDEGYSPSHLWDAQVMLWENTNTGTKPMSESNHNHHRLEDASREHVHHPSWKRMHRDWRVWVGVFLMLAAMTLFVMRRTLARRLPVQPQTQLSKET